LNPLRRLDQLAFLEEANRTKSARRVAVHVEPAKIRRCAQGNEDVAMAKAAAAVAGNPPFFHFVMIKPTHYDDDGYPSNGSAPLSPPTRWHA
jgi:hypothetical protein